MGWSRRLFIAGRGTYWLLRNYDYLLDPRPLLIMRVAIISYKQLTWLLRGENYGKWKGDLHPDFKTFKIFVSQGLTLSTASLVDITPKYQSNY